MSITQILIAIAQRQIDPEDGFRELLAHSGWLVPIKPGASSAREVETNVANTRSAWIMSDAEQYEAACRRYAKEAIGSVVPAAHLDEVIAELPLDLWILRIEPGGPVSVPLQGDDLATFRAVARGVYVERALAEQRFAEVRAYDRFIVAYADTPGQPSETIVLETKRGLMVAAFTTEGAALRFRAAVPADALPSVRFAIRDGATLFGDLPADARGVIVNGRGPESFHVDRAACRAVAEAR